MFDRLKRRFSAAEPPPASGLAQRLGAYPPFGAPHAGFGAALGLKEARENLAHFQAVLPQRLEALGALLTAEGIVLGPALAAPREHGPALADALGAWAARTWPALHQPRLAAQQAWLQSTRAGEDIVLSLVLDVAIALGEVIRRGNPDWRWDLDLSRRNLTDEMPSARRVVLLADPVGAMKEPFVNDVEDVVVGRYQHPEDTSYRLPGINPWRRLVEEGIAGSAMAYWKGTPSA